MELRLLGPVRVATGADVVEPGPRQRRLVLAVLALEVNRAVPRDRLVEWIWPDDPPRSAAHAVQVHVSHLRGVLGDDMAIVAEGDGYLLRADPHRIDVHRFLDGVARARTAPNDRARVGLLDEALALWTGPALADAASPEIRERLCGALEETRLAAMEDRFDALLRLGGHHELIGELTTLVDAHPTRERLVGQLMLARHRAGQTDRALELARRTRALLAEELGVDPGVELQQLELAILRNDTTAAPPAPHPEPEAPDRRTGLIGRDTDVADVVGRLADDNVRLLTLTGPGGVGKTRLAVEAARRMSDGVTVVPLAPVRDPSLVLPTIASSLAIQDTVGTQLRTTLAVSLRQRRVVLLLDNLEHLLDAAPDIGWLLDAASGVTVLATSRAPLRLRGEHVRPVEPLDPPSAVTLFTERAAQAGATGDLDPDVVAAICQRLDRLPLAIELAAARTRLLSPTALLDQLQRSHDLLADGARDLPARHRALRATVAWSYDLLSPDEQAMLQAVAVFAGGWTVPTAAAVADLDQTTTLRLLGSLLDGSLITRQDNRFTLLETVRAFALAQSDDRLSVFRDRHSAYVRDFVQAARRGADGPDQGMWFDRLREEQDNLRAALRWLLDQGRAEECAGLLAFIPYWVVGGHLEEYRRWAAEALAGSLSTRSRAGVLALYGFAVFGVDQAAGVEATAEAVRLARSAGDPLVLAQVLLMRGHVAMWVEDQAHAAEVLSEASDLFVDTGFPGHLALARAARASVAMGLGQPDEAARVLAELEAERRPAGGWDLGVTMVYRGYVLLRLGDWAAAERVVRGAIALTHQFGSGTTMMYALHYLAVITANTSRPHRAALLAGAAALLVEQSGPSMLRAAVRDLIREATEKLLADLGPSELDRLFQQGRSLSWAEVVDLVITP
ncbi:BTAD domain-containing putative transcriptional regulator [Kutzneria sp. NPDC052558]|uniref:BTAD domain-containing putative transcriptional regulator n=1 Tax=Kutzneria sp. NPDC052558 TaxID=3364121 RepID=UPI0037CC09C7